MVPRPQHRGSRFDHSTFAAVVEHARLNRYVSDDHFTVDGAPLEA
jgi:hypothetical protein